MNKLFNHIASLKGLGMFLDIYKNAAKKKDKRLIKELCDQAKAAPEALKNIIGEDGLVLLERCS